MAPPSLDVVKMEDRKRPLPDDSAPAPKRQAVTVNGARSQQDADVPPWKDDIEAYQKDAILRQMREYKREKNLVDAELKEVEKRAKHHDDHLRIIDAWFDQVIDEVKILSGEKLTSAPDGPRRSIPASIFFKDSDTFKEHLSGRKEKIISALSGLFARFPPNSQEVDSLQQQLSKLLALQKEHICELQRVTSEKEQISDRLDTATHRYMVAEKKMDRLRSAQIQKLEKQATAGGSVKDEPSTNNNGPESANGLVNPALNEELETARDAAIAEASKRKEQLSQLEAENKKMTEEITSLKVKLSGLSDEHYAKSDLFKTFKSLHEDVIKRVNNLEALNIQLREEAQKYQAERTAYRIKIDDEARAAISESEGNVARAEADLARIRHSRDELLAKIAVLEAGQKNNDVSREQTKDLASACDHRITALESECQRLRLELKRDAETETETDRTPPSLDGLSTHELHQKIATLESQYKLLSNELPAMEAAWKKAQTLAGKKIAEVFAWEENVTRANADKVKADQKFFAAMKAKEALEQQIRAFRAQALKSTEVVAQLKEADSASRSLVDKLEKQTAEIKAQLDELSIQHRVLQQKVNEGTLASDTHMSLIAELKKLIEAKDTAFLAAKHAQRESEVDRDKLKAEVKGLEKQCEQWKQKSLGDQSDEASMMQSMLQCQVCKNNFKDTILKNCGHIFCNSCVQDRLINRARKCPNCSKAFGANDTMRVHL